MSNGSSREKAKELFRLTAAPTNLVGNLAHRKVDVWFNCHDGMIGAEQVNLDAAALKDVFSQHRSVVQRDLLAHLRQEQRHLFDGYVYARRDELAAFLQRGVSKATWAVGDCPWGPDKKSQSAMREAFSRVALALLASRILEDKGALGEGRGQSPESRQLLHDARQRWDSFFDTVLDVDLPRLDGWFQHNLVDAMLRCLLSHLTGPINFGLVTHEMLGDLYERALVAERSAGSESFIKLKGVHYTPLSITRQILDRIPLENLPPSRRTVCDFACGSGSFLLAATERLAKLFDPREPESPRDTLTYLKNAVMGNDKDLVAILVARLSYLLAYWNREDLAGKVPYPRFHEGGDALTLDLTSAFGRRPGVIVSNPPFDVEGQPASAFLLRALEVLSRNKEESCHSYLGMVMPGAFLAGEQNQRKARLALLGVAHLLEVWELPEQAIGRYAEAPTCVILAEVSSRVSDRRLVRVAQTFSRREDSVSLLRDAAVPTWSYVASSSGEEGRNGQGLTAPEGFTLSPIDDLWDRVVLFHRSVSMLAEAVWGFLHTKDKSYPNPEFSSESQGNDLVPFLKHQSALAPYTVTNEDWFASHNNDQRYWKRGTGPGPRTQNWPKYESPKILVTAAGNRNAQSQLIAALDTKKIYPGKHFLSVVLRHGWASRFRDLFGNHTATDSDILRWLCAILNSPLGHAWFAKHAGPRGPRAEVATGMPLPRSFDPAIPEFVAHIAKRPRPRNIRLYPTWNPEGGINAEESKLIGEERERARRDNDYWRAIVRLNELVLQSYEVGPNELSRVLAYLDGMTNPWAGHEPDVATLPGHTILRVLRGKTISVDLHRQEVKAELSWRTLGGGKAIEIPIPKFMPGWALGEGQEFTCRAPAGTPLELVVANPWLLRDFRPIPYSYLSVEALETMVGFKEVVGR